MKKLQAARDKGGMVGERRVVTMLFCDLKGSTAAAERLDPEDWTRDHEWRVCANDQAGLSI